MIQLRNRRTKEPISDPRSEATRESGSEARRDELILSHPTDDDVIPSMRDAKFVVENLRRERKPQER